MVLEWAAHTHTQMFLIRACVLCINREEGLGQCTPFFSLPKSFLPFLPLAETLMWPAPFPKNRNFSFLPKHGLLANQVLLVSQVLLPNQVLLD